MIFNTWAFAIFAILALLGYWSFVPRRLRPHALIVLGCIFYTYAYPPYLLLIGLLALVTYIAAICMLKRHAAGKSSATYVYWAGIAASVLTLAVFKYAPLIISSLAFAFPIHVTLPQIIVPLAISFFSFEFVHVLVDVHKGKIKELKPLDFAAFTMFFPTLVAGPIKRYEDFAPQLAGLERPDKLVIMANMYRILLGLAKKILIADSMTALTQPLLTPGPLYTTADYWVAVFAYTIKIYFDFTGYSDIAIGVAGLLGFTIQENFDRPYWSENIGIFWRRWHMSLSSWIRDYIFIPLGGSRGGNVRTLANLALVMAIAGLWHGASWHFVAWGLWHGIGLGAQRVWSQTLGSTFAAIFPSRLLLAVSTLVTFLFVAVGWVLFASPSIGGAFEVFAHLL